MGRALRDTPWPVLLLLASFLCPTELSVYVGGARLPPHRALLLLLIVPAFLTALFGRRHVGARLFDAAVFGFAIWTLIVYVYHHGSSDGLQSGGALALDALGSFLVTRAFVRDDRALGGTAGSLLLAVSIAAVIALPEMLLGRIFLHELLREATGYTHPVGVETRMGLTRAFGVFDHPIHMGTFCAGILALAVYGARDNMGSAGRFAIVAIGALTSLSSAPMLSLAAQSAMIGFDKATRGIKGRVYIAVGMIVAAFGAVSVVATRSPFAIIATGFTLDSWTGYYRLMIWEHGLENVWVNPVFGLGLNDWERPQWMASPTVDSFWLILMMRSGLPALVLLVVAMCFLGRGVGKRMRRTGRERRRLSTGWMISLIALTLVGCTVHYWNVPYAFFFFFLGLGGCLADPLRERVVELKDAPLVQPVERVQWIRPGAGTPPPIPVNAMATPPATAARSAFPAPVWPVPIAAAEHRASTGRRALTKAG